jgi:hypothetical protein
MFGLITKRRHEVQLAQVERENVGLEVDLQEANTEYLELYNEKTKLVDALKYIISQRTMAANATVTRMADKAEEALGLKVAQFIDEDVKPAGTLAQISRMLKSPKSSTVNTVSNGVDALPIASVAVYDWTGLNTVDTPTTTDSSYGGYAGGGDSFSGGGASGSWSDSSSSSSYDSCSSDSGSSCDSGGGGGD